MRGSTACVAATLSIGAVTAFFVPLRAADGQSRVVYDDEHGSVVLTAPQGWTFDNETRRDGELRARLYPVGVARTNASAVISVRTAAKKAEPNLDAFIRADAERHLARTPGVQVSAGDSLSTARDEVAPVRYVSSSSGFETVVYLEGPAVYLTITLTAATRAAWEEQQAALTELVKSYHIATVKGTIKK